MTELTIRRILVALDASANSLAALQTAARLAAASQAELIGLFVEDINLIHLAGLPFAREVRTTSPTYQPLSQAGMEQALRLQATRARRLLAQTAGQAGVPWSFRVTRGHVTSEVMAAAREADLLTLGKQGRAIEGPRGRRSGYRVRLGSTARTVATRALRPVLLYFGF